MNRLRLLFVAGLLAIAASSLTVQTAQAQPPGWKMPAGSSGGSWKLVGMTTTQKRLFLATVNAPAPAALHQLLNTVDDLVTVSRPD